MLSYEHFSQPVLPSRKWLRRVGRSVWCAVLLDGVALAIGIAGYMAIGGLSLVDSILEASMILGGMGPIAPLTTTAAKLFASIYALLSGLIVIGTTGIVLAPWVHRLLHHFYHERRRTTRSGERTPKNGKK